MSEAASLVALMENEVLKSFNLTLDSFSGPSGAPGGRRPLRFFPTDLTLADNTDSHGPHLTLTFTLPPGSYATVLLGEIMKEDITID